MTSNVPGRFFFTIVLIILSTANARSLRYTLNKLINKPAETENLISIRAKSKLNIPFKTINNGDAPQFKEYVVTTIPLVFKTRTKLLPLERRNNTRYHVTETFLPYSQYYKNGAHVRDNQAIKLPTLAPVSDFLHQSVPEDSEKFGKTTSIDLSSFPTINMLKGYENSNVHNVPSNKSSKEYHNDETPNLFGLSYLSAEEAIGLPDPDKNVPSNPAKSLSGYQHYHSDSTESFSYPRFSIPLKSLLLDNSESTDYNIETSEIIEPTFILPDGNYMAKVPQPSLPTVTYGVTINDGNFTRKEIRKDNGEFFSSYKDSDVVSANVGSLVPTAGGDQVLVLRGSYSFTSPEGLRFRVDYKADETGYHATQVPISAN